jgi:hypothetical protein
VTRLVLLFIAVSGVSASIFWPYRARSHETVTTTVLFDREIVRILDTHCVMCHAADGPSFPLESYEQTWLRRRDLRDEVIARHMPPWAAVPGYGRFRNDNSLTLRESQFVVSWVEGLGPRNAGTVFTNIVDAGARPPDIRSRMLHAGHWHLGEPGLTVAMPPAGIEAGQPGHVTRTTIPLPLSSPRRVRAVEYMPGDRRVVRAAFFTVQETGQWIGSWTPWYGYVEVPEGAAFTLPAESHIVAEVHYRGTSERVTDEGKLGLSFADGPSGPQVSDLVLQAAPAAPAGAAGQRLRVETRLAADTSVFALRPEMAGGITSIEVSARTPSGGTEILLYARDFDEAWPTPYILEAPVLLPRGTVLSVTGYANTGAPKPVVRLTVSGYPADRSRN